MTATLGADIIRASDGSGPVEFPDGIITGTLNGEDISGGIATDAYVVASTATHNASATAHADVAHIWTVGQTFQITPIVQTTDYVAGYRLNTQNAPVGIWTDSATFNGTRDDRLWFAYNMMPSGGSLIKAVAGEPHEALVMEGNYNNGAYSMTELNLDYYSGDGLTSRRWMHQDTNRATHAGIWQWWAGDGTGPGDLVINQYHNIGMGGTAVDIQNARVTILAADHGAVNFALQIADDLGNPIFVQRNDGRVGIKKNTFAGGSVYLEVSGGTRLDGGNITIVNAPVLWQDISGDAAAQLYSIIKNTHDTGSAPTQNLSFFTYVKPGVSTLPGEVQLFVADDADYRTLALQPFGGHIKFKGDQYDIPSARLTASQWSIRLDEATNTIKFIAKYADGTTIKTGTVALV